jgi:hypothetical protein
MKNNTLLAKRKGFTLIFIIFVISSLFFLGMMLQKIIYSSASAFYSERDYLRAYYLAEGAIEYGKAAVKHDPNWVSSGLKFDGFEVTRKPNSNEIAGIGYTNNSRVVLKFGLGGP